MGREKRTMAGPPTARERHRRRGNQIDRNAPLPEGLVARKAVGKMNHRTYLEIVENKDFKRKPLDFENTTQREPPELFTFVPLGNPELTTLCKDMSRERGALVFIVSTPSGLTTDMAYQVNRVGYHFRSAIVEEAMGQLDVEEMHRPLLGPNGVEVIPHSQQEINEQADAALRELFPKIPHTDRGEIISHAFRKGKQTNGEPVVGLQTELPLSRRVQLAVLAHIRHRHTRYDKLLRETTWANARRVTEDVCLDYLVKWRGDDESGRDQLDEILREVVVLSDDDSDDEDESSSEADDSLSKETSPQPSSGLVIPGIPSAPVAAGGSLELPGPSETIPNKAKTPKGRSRRAQKREKKKNERGFKRYGATRRLAVWERAVQRMRAASETQSPDFYSPDPNGSASRASPFREVNTPLDAGPAPYQIDLTSPQGTVVEGRTANGAFRTPPYIHAHPVYPAHAEVSGIAQRASPIGYGDTRSTVWQPAGVQTQLQDMLHPSVEPLSPGGATFGHGHRPIVHERLPLEPRRYHDDQMPREVIVIREHHDPAPPSAYHGHYSHESATRRVEPPPLLYEDHARGPYIQDRQDHPSGWGQQAYSGPSAWDVGHSLSSRMHGAHLSTDERLHHSKSYPQMRPLEYGEPPRNGNGPSSRVTEVHQPLERSAQHVRYSDAGQAPYSQGAFLTLREHPPPQSIPRDEGFIRLREAPVIHREAPPQQDLYRPEDPYLLVPVERQPNGGERAFYAPSAGPAYIRQDVRPPEDQGAYDHRAGPYPHPHEGRRFGYQEILPATGRARRQHPYERRQTPRTPLQHHQDVVIIDS